MTVDSTWCNIISISLIYTQGTRGFFWRGSMSEELSPSQN